MVTTYDFLADIESKFLDSVRRACSGCWEWTAYRNRDGYGSFCVRRRSELAHRVAYTLFCGTIPNGTCVLHCCDNPSCCNPVHLFLGTQADNMHDMARKGRTRTGVMAGTIPAPRKLGEQNGRARLTATDISEIRFAVASGIPHAEIATRFGITSAYVCNIAKRRRWAHL